MFLVTLIANLLLCLFFVTPYFQRREPHRAPLAMPMYAIAMILLNHHFTDGPTQAWYADDAHACGRLSSLHLWWASCANFDWALAIFPMLPKLS